MKLLFDENLSYRLVSLLAGDYPDSAHVRALGLSGANDTAVWTFAEANGFTIVSKDSDFQQRAVLYGSPPKVVWIRAGNCSTGTIAELLRSRKAVVQAFDVDATESILVIS